MKPVHFYTIKSCGGLKVEVSNLGAKITKLIPPPLSRQGKDIGLVDVVLGFRTADEWLNLTVSLFFRLKPCVSQKKVVSLHAI